MPATAKAIVQACTTYGHLLAYRKQNPDERQVCSRLANRFRQQCSKKGISTINDPTEAHAEWLDFVKRILNRQPRTRQRRRPTNRPRSGQPSTTVVFEDSSTLGEDVTIQQGQPEEEEAIVRIQKDQLFRLSSDDDTKDDIYDSSDLRIATTNHTRISRKLAQLTALVHRDKSRTPPSPLAQLPQPPTPSQQSPPPCTSPHPDDLVDIIDLDAHRAQAFPSFNNFSSATTQRSTKTSRVETLSPPFPPLPQPLKKQRCTSPSMDVQVKNTDYESSVLAQSTSANEDESGPSFTQEELLSSLMSTQDGLCDDDLHSRISSTDLDTESNSEEDSTDDDNMDCTVDLSLAELIVGQKTAPHPLYFWDVFTRNALGRCSWLCDNEKSSIQSLWTEELTVAPAEVLSPILQAIHAPLLLPDCDAKDFEQLSCIVELLHSLVKRCGKAYVQCVREEDVECVANAVRLHAQNSDLLHTFLKYVNTLVSFTTTNEYIHDWVEKAWPVATVLSVIMERHMERNIVVESLRLISTYAEKKGQELVVDHPSAPNVLHTVFKEYREDHDIQLVAEKIINLVQMWSGASLPRRQPTLIFSNVAHAVLEALDPQSLKTRRDAEDNLRGRINASNNNYFSDAVRGRLVLQVLAMCGQARLCRDIAHHAINIIDIHFSNEAEPIQVDSEVCQNKLLACVLLAVRIESNIVQVPPFLVKPQVDITARKLETTGWRIFLQRCLALPSKPVFWLQQIICRALEAVPTTDEKRRNSLLHANTFGNAVQRIDIMVLFASELPYRLMAAVAFRIVYESFHDVSERCLTEVTGYPLVVIQSVVDAIVRGSTDVRPYHVSMDGTGGQDAMKQPVYDQELHLCSHSPVPIPPGDWCTERVGEEPAPLEVWKEEKGGKSTKMGEGTYGQVRKVTRFGTDEPYALKTVTIKTMNSTALREIDILRYSTRFQLPHVCPLVHVDATLGKPRDVRIWLPLCDQSLAARIWNKKTPLTPTQIRTFFHQLMTGLSELHAAGMLHRDLKPSNILLRSGEVGEELLIADFGLSRIQSQPNNALTGEVATLNYMAVELLCGNKKYTSAFDMWSMGCILAEMITGELLFHGSDADELRLTIVLKLGVPPPDQMVDPLPQTSDADPRAFLRDVCKNLPLEDQESAADLLHLLLQVDFTKRIRARDALLHPYFVRTGTRVPSQPCPAVEIERQVSEEQLDDDPLIQHLDEAEMIGQVGSVILMTPPPKKSTRKVRVRRAQAPQTPSLSTRNMSDEMNDLAQQTLEKPLEPTQWLSDIHINFGMGWLNYHSCYLKNSNHAFCFNTYVLGTTRTRSRPFHNDNVMHPTATTAGSLTVRFRLFPLHIRRSHWILAVHDSQSGVLYVLDSLCWKVGEEVQALKQLLGVRSETVALLTTPLQKNEHDCGCWTIAFATAIVNALDWTPSTTDTTLFTGLKVGGFRDRLLDLATNQQWKTPQ